jgi:hypothetical protein
MKPLNLDNSPCTPTSSNCVIWQGPNIPCIKLCTGDTISDVVAKLATELCTILDYLNVENYDLSCFNLATCPPTNFQELTQFLIGRICALENIDPATVTTETTVPLNANKSPLVTNYLMTANVVFGGGTIKLVDYVNDIAGRISTILTEIAIINVAITNLDTRVTVLETTPPPVFTLPTVTLACVIDGITGVQPLNDAVDAIATDFCSLLVATGQPSDLIIAIAAQCIDGTDPSEKFKYSVPGTQMNIAYPTYVTPAVTVADAISNLWLALCDVRDAGKELVTLTAGNNITITPVVSVVGDDQVTDYTITGKEAIVAAGTNVTVTSATVGNDTTYTVNGKDSIVVGADDIVVTPVTVGNATTYTVSRPKENFYSEATGSVDVDSDPVPNTSVFHFPIGYNTLTYTNTTGSTKTYIVQASFDSEIPSALNYNGVGMYNGIIGGIVTTVLGIDTTEWESSGASTLIEGSLFDGPLVTDFVNTTTAETVVTTPSTNAVEFRFKNLSAAKNASFFKKVTLNNNETVSLKFRTVAPGVQSYITQAQIYVQEI